MWSWVCVCVCACTCIYTCTHVLVCGYMCIHVHMYLGWLSIIHVEFGEKVSYWPIFQQVGQASWSEIHLCLPPQGWDYMYHCIRLVFLHSRDGAYLGTRACMAGIWLAELSSSPWTCLDRRTRETFRRDLTQWLKSRVLVYQGWSFGLISNLVSPKWKP